jgi:DNA-binding Lrp family transcriptional regulator
MKTHEKLSGWLFSTLQFTVKNIQRVQRRRQARERLAALERAEMATPRLAHSSELHEQLDAAVAHLTGVDRSAILLRYYQDLSFEQIAQTLNISEAAARKRVTRAVDGLRRRVGIEITPALLSIATGFGVQHTPANLAQNIGHLAISAKAGAALPAGILSTTKGTVKLMIAAKLKVAALIAIGLAVSIPVAVVAVETATPNPPASPATPIPGATVAVAADTPAAADAPDWMAEFIKIYSLGPDQVVKLVPPPFSDVRQKFLDKQQEENTARIKAMMAANSAGGSPTGPAGNPFTAPPPGTVLGGAGGGGVGITMLSARVGGAGMGGVMVQSGPPDAAIFSQTGSAFQMKITSPPGAVNGNTGFGVYVLSQVVLGVPASNIECDKTLLRENIPGDFVFSTVATQEQLRAGLEKLVSDETGQSITLQFRDVNVDTYVLSGTWSYKPVDALETSPTPLIHVYDSDMEDKMGAITQTGTSDNFATSLGSFANVRVLIEAQGAPDSIQFRTHYDGMARNRNAQAILNHIADQTGLTWKKESLPVSHLFIEKAR